MELLKIEHVCKTYGTGNENQVKALDDVSFTVKKGEFVAITGPSGSGKSTLLHILGGIDRPTEGNVWIGGVNLKDMNETKLSIFRRRQVGLIYQFYNLIPVLDVEENIMLPLLLDGQKKDERYLEELIATLGLENRRHHLPGQLSGGQQQRVSIGRALMNHPSVILADEPTGNLDRKNSAEIIALLKETNKKYQQTLIMITHDENIALQSDRILYLEDGKMQEK
ncbi:ABC transporter ATP-binding protein [Lachnospiraceae bacterium 50-23]|jgi:putative ABC transport system ATP-binding protein|nr:ABC transporter ATP-binding protein [Dorea sp.]GFI36315.1 lipoprotein-releasing system ATP-binding protein LolD [Lachnospiraceae bacterium]